MSDNLGTEFDEVMREQINELLDQIAENDIVVNDTEGHVRISEIRHKLSRIVILSHPAASNMCERSDLLARQCAVKRDLRRNWLGMAADLGDYGTTGGSASDARRVVEAMASMERQVKDIRKQ